MSLSRIRLIILIIINMINVKGVILIVCCRNIEILEKNLIK